MFAGEARLPGLCLSSDSLGGSPVCFVRISHAHPEGELRNRGAELRGSIVRLSLAGTRCWDSASCSVPRTLAVARARLGGRSVGERSIASASRAYVRRPMGFHSAAVRRRRAVCSQLVRRQTTSRALGRRSQPFINPGCGSSVQHVSSVTGQSPCGEGRLTTRSRQQPIALRSSFLFDWDYSVCRRGSPPKAVPQL